MSGDREREMLWSGRFAGGPHPDMFRLTASLETDIRLLPYDLQATQAHARVLVDAGILDETALHSIDEACAEILEAYEKGSLEGHLLDAPLAEATDCTRDEDVHSLVERELTERLGDVGASIHAGRSRNDLVATDLRLWTRARTTMVLGRLASLLDAIAARAEEHAATVMPGYTHLQRAQSITVGYHLLAHGFALARDAGRFLAAYRACDESVLGAGALAGTTLPLRPEIAREELEAEMLFDNAMDAVAQRDFICDFVYASALCEVHISRLAEEIVTWTSSEFAFARLPDDWSTGSSMMPQKRNPDLAELLRGRAAGGVADLTGMLTLLKGLPLAYDRDLQEDKGYLFRTGDRVVAALEATEALVCNLSFDVDRCLDAAAAGAAWATDVAEALVRRGVPFREAHEVTGRLVAALEAEGLTLADADAELLTAVHPELRAEDIGLADPSGSVARRASHGGPSHSEVVRQCAALRAVAASVTV